MPKKRDGGEREKETPGKLACGADFPGVFVFMGGGEGAGRVRKKTQKYGKEHKNASQSASKGANKNGPGGAGGALRAVDGGGGIRVGVSRSHR